MLLVLLGNLGRIIIVLFSGELVDFLNDWLLFFILIVVMVILSLIMFYLLCYDFIKMLENVK